ncbi:carbonic anhydrase [Subtercola boreus]|uniref:Carbonic anhydrase n=1 Tax=Subtercola boreus TaxID=120213 RepID=A0A3E0W9B7_9MICO|nr:carbonic anhydrase [Subtercola boreus]RFA20216.1 carbonic anhydrase [Subtercola boreus]RFA26541.1 carbonic anhydrase [Subtercola boreus]
MQQGNARFVAGTPQHPHQDVDRRNSLAAQQTPHVALFGCSDSRLAAEIIFDQGLGDLFVVRNAGQVISESVVGSLEYAVGVLGVDLIVVLGHDECGAVRAAIDAENPANPPLPPHIANLISAITPAVKRVSRESAAAGTDVSAHLVGRYHLQDTVAGILESSEMISDAIAEGRLAIVGANYRLAEGRAEPDMVIGTIEPAPAI